MASRQPERTLITHTFPMSACAFDLKIKEMVHVSSGENREDTRSRRNIGKAEGFAFNDIRCVCVYIYIFI